MFSSQFHEKLISWVWYFDWIAGELDLLFITWIQEECSLCLVMRDKLFIVPVNLLSIGDSWIKKKIQRKVARPAHQKKAYFMWHYFDSLQAAVSFNTMLELSLDTCHSEPSSSRKILHWFGTSTPSKRRNFNDLTWRIIEITILAEL